MCEIWVRSFLVSFFLDDSNFYFSTFLLNLGSIFTYLIYVNRNVRIHVYHLCCDLSVSFCVHVFVSSMINFYLCFFSNLLGICLNDSFNLSVCRNVKDLLRVTLCLVCRDHSSSVYKILYFSILLGILYTIFFCCLNISLKHCLRFENISGLKKVYLSSFFIFFC